MTGESVPSQQRKSVGFHRGNITVRITPVCQNRRRLRPPRHDPHHAQALDTAKSLSMNLNLLDRLLAPHDHTTRSICAGMATPAKHDTTDPRAQLKRRKRLETPPGLSPMMVGTAVQRAYSEKGTETYDPGAEN